ncbi:MAG: hypothetical protein Ct9H300mP21_02540 [Pseudomonadota bacterium]|nr:MAG: hypothetical protein Ct9H300mP21_02540 [Pseudomonadota bacterium]
MDNGVQDFSRVKIYSGQRCDSYAQELELKEKAEKSNSRSFLLYKNKIYSTRLLEISAGNPAGCFGPEYNQQGKNPSLKKAPDHFLCQTELCQ